MDLSFRDLEAADVPELEALLLANQPLFTNVECDVALEVIREGLEKRESEDAYRFLVAVNARQIVGYVCFGAIALARGSYDLYWIAVHPEFHARGIGKRLLGRCEQIIAGQGGRVIVAETSSVNAKAQRFYRETMGYDLAAQITDFYGPGEDRMTYVKYIATQLPARIVGSSPAEVVCLNGEMRIVALSDQHGHLPEIPPCDLLIIAGDTCPDRLGPFLDGSSVTIWATPWSNQFMNWAFMKAPAELGAVYAAIPGRA